MPIRRSRTLSALLLMAVCAPAYGQPLSLVTYEFPPYVFTRNQLIQGHSVDLIRRAARQTGCQLHITMLPYNRAIHMVKTGRADGIFPLLSNATDESSLYPLRPPILTAELYLFQLRKTPEYRRDRPPDAAPGRSVAVPDNVANLIGTDLNAIMEDRPIIEHVYDTRQTIRMLTFYRVDSIVADYSTIAYESNQHRLNTDAWVATPYKEERGYVAIALSQQFKCPDLERRLAQLNPFPQPNDIGVDAPPVRIDVSSKPLTNPR